MSDEDKAAVDRHEKILKVKVEEAKAKAVAERELREAKAAAEAKAAEEKVTREAKAAEAKAAADAKAAEAKTAAEKATAEKATAEKAAAEKAAAEKATAEKELELKAAEKAAAEKAAAEKAASEKELELKAEREAKAAAEKAAAEKAAAEAIAAAEKAAAEKAAAEKAAAEKAAAEAQAATEAKVTREAADAKAAAEREAAEEAERLKTEAETKAREEEAERLKIETAAVREAEEEYNKATKLKETALAIPNVKIKYDEIMAEIKEAKTTAENESQRKTASERLSAEHAAEDKLRDAKPDEKQQAQTELDALYVNSLKELITDAVIQLNTLIKINPSDTKIEQQELLIKQAEARFTKRKMDDFIKLGQVGDEAKPILNEAEAFIKYAEEKIKVLTKAIQAASQTEVQTEVQNEGQPPIQIQGPIQTEVKTEVKTEGPSLSPIQTEVPSQVKTEVPSQVKTEVKTEGQSPIEVSPESEDQMNARLNYLTVISISSEDTDKKITEVSNDVTEILKKIDKEELKAYPVTDGLKYVFPLIYNEFEKIKKGEVNKLKEYVEKINTNLSENIVKHAKIQFMRKTIKDQRQWKSRKEKLGTILVKQPYTVSYSALKGEDEMIQETPKDLLTKESIEYIILAIEECIKGLVLDIESPDAKKEHEKDLNAAKSLLQQFKELVNKVTPTNQAKVKPNPLENQKIKDLKTLIKPQAVLNLEICQHLFNNKHLDDAIQASFNEMCKDFVLIDMMYNDIDIYKKKTFDLIKKHLFIFYPKFILLYHLSQ